MDMFAEWLSELLNLSERVIERVSESERVIEWVRVSESEWVRVSDGGSEWKSEEAYVSVRSVSINEREKEHLWKWVSERMTGLFLLQSRN